MNLSFMMLFLCLASDLLLAKNEDINEKITRLTYENDLLSERFDLAKSGKFYLMANLPEKKIQLMLRNVSLKEYPIKDIEIGRRVILFIAAWSSSLEISRVFTQGKISPSRVIKRFQIIPPEENVEETSSEEERPSLMEAPKPKKIKVPYLFRLTFQGGFALEIYPSKRDDETPGFLSRLLSYLRCRGSEFFSLFRRDGSLRLRCFLTPEDQRSFYQIVPDDISLLLVMKSFD